MTLAEAAVALGCTVNTVRNLINAGKLKAKERPMPGGFYYVISPAEVERVKRQPKPTRGWPRGKSRS